MKKWKTLILLPPLLVSYFSCSDSEVGDSYDPGKPLKLEFFQPDTGKIATTVVLKGENFGNDPSKLNVYFNNKKATVVGVKNGYAYVITPRMPGDTCTISVAIGNDSLAYKEDFYYKVTSNVTTYLGKETTTGAFKGGSFADTEFCSQLSHVHFDNNNVMLLSVGAGATETKSTIIMVDEAGDLTKDCWPAGQNRSGARVMDTDSRTGITLVGDRVGDVIYELDPDNLYVVKRKTINRPSAEQIASGEYINWPTVDYKQSLGFCHYDHFFYTHIKNGSIIKWDPLGANVGTLVDDGSNTGITGSPADIQLAFSPHPDFCHLMFFSHTERHAIYAYDVRYPGTQRLVGNPYTGVGAGNGGHVDGTLAEAEFNRPRQICFNLEGDKMYVADQYNHVIREIDMITGTVSTLAGKPGVSGYLDGGPEEALFNNPFGVKMDQNEHIFVVDQGNRRVRKIAIE